MKPRSRPRYFNIHEVFQRFNSLFVFFVSVFVFFLQFFFFFRMGGVFEAMEFTTTNPAFCQKDQCSRVGEITIEVLCEGSLIEPHERSGLQILH